MMDYPVEYLVEYYFEDEIIGDYRTFKCSYERPIYYGFNADEARAAYVQACPKTNGITSAVVVHVREANTDDWVWLTDNEIHDPHERLFSYISLDNGRTFMTAEDAMFEITECHLWDAVVNAMDDDLREKVHAQFAPCSNAKFLREYLVLSPTDLVIG